MRIAVIGTGGIGGPYGASLAKAGADVSFVARGAHLAAMRQNGLRVEGARGENLRALCDAAGFDGILSPDIMVPVWQKFLLLVPLANVNSLTRLPLGKYRADPDLWTLVEASLRETAAVGRAEGIDLPPDAEEHGLAMIRSMPDHHMTSMGNDLLRGN